MRGMNRVILVGNTGKDAEVKKVGNGISVTKVSLATTETYAMTGGARHSETQWNTIVFWRGLADLAARYLRKGSLVLVEGRVVYRKYTDKAGVLKYVTEIVADKMLLLDQKSLHETEPGAAVEDRPLPF